MSDTIVLKKVYALDSNTGLFISANKTLFTDGKGGAIWTDIFSTMAVAGGSSVGNLPSTISTLSSVQYLQGLTIKEVQVGLSTNYPTSLTPVQLTSSLIGLGTFGYISTQSLTSSLANLSQIGYLSTPSLLSTVEGIGSSGYLSTSALTSSLTGLGSIGYLSTANLTSTVAGLGTSLYISSLSLISSVAGIGSMGYISTASLDSTISRLGTLGYISTASLTSTVRGLGSIGYISSPSLESTVIGIQSTMANIRFDNVGNVNITNSVVAFSNVSTVLFTSTIYCSSFSFVNSNGSMEANVIGDNDLIFSTAKLDLTPFSKYIYESTLVALDIYPTYVFSKLGSGATSAGVLPLSTMLQVGTYVLPGTTTTNFLVANQCKIPIDNTTFIDGSNVYQTPIRLEIPKGSITTYTSTYTILHKMPGGLASNVIQNALDNKTVGVYFDTNKSIKITIQNIPGV